MELMKFMLMVGKWSRFFGVLGIPFGLPLGIVEKLRGLVFRFNGGFEEVGLEKYTIGPDVFNINGEMSLGPRNFEVFCPL